MNNKLVMIAASVLTLSSTVAFAIPVLELDCRIDNSLVSSAPRTIKLRDGMIESVDCTKHASCKNSIYKISMNYNSYYETVTVRVTDTEVKKEFSTDHLKSRRMFTQWRFLN